MKTINFNAVDCNVMGNATLPVFSGCSQVTKLNIANNVTKIPDYSFTGCTNLNTIVSYATIVPATYTNSFNGLAPAKIAVTVPCNTLTYYKSDTFWNIFSNMTDLCENYTVTVTAGANGQISPSSNQSLAFGGNITFTFTPNTNYEISQVLIDGVNNPVAVSSGSYTFANVNGNHSISVTFKLEGSVYITTAANNASGTVFGGGLYDRNATVTLFAVPQANTVFETWSDGNTNNPRTVIASGNLTFTAIFTSCNMAALLEQIAELEGNLNTANSTISILLTQNADLQNQLDECIGGTSEKNVRSASAISIYPNPAKEELRIESGELKIEKVEIFDIKGSHCR